MKKKRKLTAHSWQLRSQKHKNKTILPTDWMIIPHNENYIINEKVARVDGEKRSEALASRHHLSHPTPLTGFILFVGGQHLTSLKFYFLSWKSSWLPTPTHIHTNTQFPKIVERSVKQHMWKYFKIRCHFIQM